MIAARANLFGVGCMFLSSLSCGEDDANSAEVLDGSSDAAVCAPQLAAWESTWAPPRPFMPGACTSEQIAAQARCNRSFDVFDESACNAFQRSTANVTCRKCLLSYTADPTHGPVVIHADYRWFVNIEGCVALIDGDTSQEGCGARYDAANACREAACANCPGGSAFTACWREAGESVCKPYVDNALCAQSPVFGPCLDYDTYEELYYALSALFCSTGFGVTVDGGGASDAAVEATTSD
jgi:hypothetical protein